MAGTNLNPYVSSSSGYSSPSNSKSSQGTKTEATSFVSQYAQNGAKTVDSKNSMNKDAFLKILCAELANQDPMKGQDSTQYVTQLSQFAGLEQMANLNSTLRFQSGYGLANKGVVLKYTDATGAPLAGVVVSTMKVGDDVKIAVHLGSKLDEEGNVVDDIREYMLDDIVETFDMRDSFSDQVNSNLNFYTATNLVGKDAEFAVKGADGKTSTVRGEVLSAAKKNTDIVLSVKMTNADGKTEVKEFSYGQLVKVIKPGEEIPEEKPGENPNPGTGGETSVPNTNSV